MPKICLSIVFNHQFEKNIPKLNELYEERFSFIRYLSPFSTGETKNVISIYETSIHFQGYFSQAYQHLPKNCDYYVFCADDLILNPSINENNLVEFLNCEKSAYIKYLNPIWTHSFSWHKFEDCNDFPPKNCLVPYEQFLPYRKELLKTYAKHGFTYKNIGFHNLTGIVNKEIRIKNIYSGIKYLIRNKFNRYVHYPLVEGYSDFIVIPKKYLKSFCHYCGIFAAMNTWVDAGVATSLILSNPSIKQEKDTNYYGTEIWDDDKLASKLSETNNRIKEIEDIFEDHELYIHPIKLSKFN